MLLTSAQRTFSKISGILLMGGGLYCAFTPQKYWIMMVLFCWTTIIAFGVYVSVIGWVSDYERRKYIKNGKKVMADVKWISGMTARLRRRYGYGRRFVAYSIICERYDEMGAIHFYESAAFRPVLNQIVRLIKSAIGSRAPINFFPQFEWSAAIPLEVYLGQIPVYLLGAEYYVDTYEFLRRVKAYKRVR